MIHIEVAGIPRPGGGKMAGYNKKTGKNFVRDDNPNTAPWRAVVSLAAQSQYKGRPLDGAVDMTYEFRFPRPKSHFGTGKKAHVLKASAPEWHTIKPDLTKVIRSTEDALTGITYTDDCRVCIRQEIKRYCHIDEQPGVSIVIQERQS